MAEVDRNRCDQPNERIYSVTETMPVVTDPNFQRGVRITYWNARPYRPRRRDRHELSRGKQSGSPPCARGVDGLMQHGLRISAPPDDEWVIVGYVDLAGEQREFRAEWSVVDLPEEESATDGPLSAEAASALGLDLEGDLHRRLNALLYSPEKVAERRRINVSKETQWNTVAHGKRP